MYGPYYKLKDLNLPISLYVKLKKEEKKST